MGDWTVRVENVWRKFGTSTQDALKYGLLDGARRVIGLDKDSEHLRPNEFWALRDVSFCQKAVTVHLFFRAHAGAFVVKPRMDRFLHDADTPAVVDFDADFQFEEEKPAEAQIDRGAHVTAS